MPSWRDARQIGPVFPGTTEENRSRAEVVGTGTDCSDRSDRTRPPGVARLGQLTRPAPRGARPAQGALAASLRPVLFCGWTAPARANGWQRIGCSGRLCQVPGKS